MDASIPPTGKREADPPTAEEEPDSKKLKHGEEEDKVDHPDLMDLFERFKSDFRTERKAMSKLMEYVVFCKRKLNPEEEIFLRKLMRGDRPPPSLSPSPPRSPVLMPMPPSPDHDSDDDELPKGYGWVSEDPFFLPGSKDFVMKKWCARCGMSMDHWANKCSEKQGEGSHFKRYLEFHNPPFTSTSTKQ